MKSFLFATVAVVALSSAAVAADAVIGDAALPVASTYNWTGAYVGAAVGYRSLRAEDLSISDAADTTGGVSGVIYAGYNHQIDNIVLGAEVDFGLASGRIKQGDDYLYTKQQWAGSIRARMGYAMDNVMPYITGGLAVARFRGDHENDGSDIASKTKAGYVIGGGIEWAMSQNVSLRGEYLFSDYGKTMLMYSGNDDHETKFRTHDFRIGAAYKF